MKKTNMWVLLVIIAFTSCEKEKDTSIVGKYKGSLIVNLPDMKDTTGACRLIKSRDGNIVSQWSSAPFIEDIITPLNNHYSIENVILLGETWCNGLHIETEFKFNGVGELQGDSLIESGVLEKYVTINGEYINKTVGNWNAKMRRF